MRYLVLTGAILVALSAKAQFQRPDSLVYAEGKIINAVTKEPVTARITYQSLPYGSKVGFFTGQSFSFPLYDNERYSVVIEAAGFAQAKYLLDPAEAGANRKIIQNVELQVPGSAAQLVPEGTHSTGKVMRLDNLIFGQGNAVITPDSYPELNEVADMMHNNPRMIIQLEGHTDVRGDPKLNMKLSQDRVNAVKDYLVRHGVEKNKIKTKAFGGTRPISTENTDQAHKLNRRVELRILEN